MTRLILVNGTWQLVMAASALRQAGVRLDDAQACVLALHGTGSASALGTTMAAFAQAAFPASTSVWVDDLLDHPTQSVASLEERTASLRSRVRGMDVGEIWLSKLFTTAEKIALGAFGAARIHVYEEGLHFYLPQPRTPASTWRQLFEPRTWPKIMRAAMHPHRWPVRHVAMNGLHPPHLERVDKAWLSPAEDLAIPPHLANKAVARIAKQTILDTLARLPATEVGELPTRPPMLVLGQCFARWGVIAWDAEARFYTQAVERMLRSGYDVLWKEHPRVDRPFLPALQQAFGEERVRLVPIEPSWPVEIFAAQYPLAGCVAVSSSALFYLRDLFGIPTYTMGSNALIRKIGYRDFKAITRLSMQCIPPLTELPEATP